MICYYYFADLFIEEMYSGAFIGTFPALIIRQGHPEAAAGKEGHVGLESDEAL